jgi:hypothetical protein
VEKPEIRGRRAADRREPMCNVALCIPALVAITIRAVGLTTRCMAPVAASGPRHLAVPTVEGGMLGHPSAAAESSDGNDEGEENLSSLTQESTACGHPRTRTPACNRRLLRQAVASAPLPTP